MTDEEFTWKEAANQARHLHLIRWLIAHSKDSATHAMANVTMAMSIFLEGLAQVFQFLDEDLRSQIVGVVGASNMKVAGMVGIGLSLGMKMTRDRRWNPFNGDDPHMNGADAPVSDPHGREEEPRT